MALKLQGTSNHTNSNGTDTDDIDEFIKKHLDNDDQVADDNSDEDLEDEVDIDLDDYPNSHQMK